MQISLELVPRSKESLENELKSVKTIAPGIESINIPDIPGIKLNGLNGAEIVQKNINKSVIPHIRARDFDCREMEKLILELERKEIEKVLVITGDYFPRKDRGGNCLQTISLIKEKAPQISVFAGLDPYRTSIKGELNYLLEKIDAGAEGFFTQPFFDTRYIELFSDLVGEFRVFWGLTPVLSSKFINYWQKKDVFFPRDFEPTWDWNIRFSQKALEVIEEIGANVYLMPIRVDVEKYLENVIGGKITSKK